MKIIHSMPMNGHADYEIGEVRCLMNQFDQLKTENERLAGIVDMLPTDSYLIGKAAGKLYSLGEKNLSVEIIRLMNAVFAKEAAEAAEGSG